MSDKRPAFEVVVGGKTVVMVELNTGEVRQAMELASKIKADDARQFDTALHGLRLSIRKIDGVAVTQADLQGENLDKRFRVRELLLLARAWNRIHIPDDADMDAVGNMKAIAG